MARKTKTTADVAHSVPEDSQDTDLLTVVLAGRALPVFEGAGDYNSLLETCLEGVPKDNPIVQLLMQDFADETWEIRRLRAMRDNLLQARFTGSLEKLLPALTRKGYRCYEYDYKYSPTHCRAYEEGGIELDFDDFEDQREYLQYIYDADETEYDWEAREIIRAYRAGNQDAVREVRHMLAMDNTSEEEIYARIVALNADDLSNIDSAITRHLKQRDGIIRDIERHSEFLGRQVLQQLSVTEAEFVEIDETGEASS